MGGSRRFAAVAVPAAAAASPPALRQPPPAAEARARAALLRSRPAEGRARGEGDDSSLLTVAASRVPVPRPPSPASSSAGPGRAGAVAWSRSPCGPAGRGARAPGGQARQWCHSFVTSPRVSAPRPARRSSFCYFFFVCLSGLTFLSFVLERKAGVVSSALNFTSCHSPPPEKRFPFETHASNCRRGSKSWSLLKERGFVWFGLVCEMKIFGKLRN